MKHCNGQKSFMEGFIMHTKTMEGLVGARTNINHINTPMRVFKEAERRGDIGTMERAMGYVGDFSKKAGEYQEKANDGMKEDAKEIKEKEKLEREKAIEKRRKERQESKAEIEQCKDEKADTVEISGEGKQLLRNAEITDETMGKETEKTDTGKQPVMYIKTGEVSQSKQGSNISVSV